MSGPCTTGTLLQSCEDAAGLSHIPDLPSRLIEGRKGFVDVNLGGVQSVVKFQQSSTQSLFEVRSRLFGPAEPEAAPKGAARLNRCRRSTIYGLLHDGVLIDANPHG
jgi:hypothetical protein